MAMKGRRKTVSSSKWRQFHHLAEVFKNASEMAREFQYWNAAGVLIVHAAIALTDAICIKVGGVKSSSEDHYQAGNLLQELVSLDGEGKGALGHFFAVVHEKTMVSYTGEIYGERDINALWKHLERYYKWAETILKT